MVKQAQTARRVVAPRYGDPDVVEVIEAPLEPPKQGQVTIEVRAAGMNPLDYKIISGELGNDESNLPLSIGTEVAGVITAIGEDTAIATGGGAVGDPVLAYQVTGGYASAITVPASDVFAKPDTLDFPQAANLLLVGVTAADMLRLVAPLPGATILVNGASGAVGASLLQQARLQDIRVIGTASERNFDVVRRFGGDPVRYGEGLVDRVRDMAPGGIVAALDCAGTDDAIDAALALAPAPQKVVTIAGFGRVQDTGIEALDGSDPASRDYRLESRIRIVELAASGDLTVVVTGTYPLDQAAQALDKLRSGDAGGKLALVP